MNRALRSSNAICLSLSSYCRDPRSRFGPSVSMVPWSLVGFEEILRFTQDDSWRVSLVVVVVVVCLSFLSKRLETEATKRSRGLGSDKF